MKIYAIEKNLNDLLLMDGLWVVNGHYDCQKLSDGAIIVHKKHGIKNAPKAYFVADVPKGWKGDYDDILERFKQEVVEGKWPNLPNIQVDAFKEAKKEKEAAE